MNSFPLDLRLAFCLQIRSYFDELDQQIYVCLSLTRYFDGNLKKQSVKHFSTGDAEAQNVIMLIRINRLRHKIDL